MTFSPDDHGNHGGTDRGGQRIAAERRPVFAGMHHAEDFAVRDHRRQRNRTATKCLAEQVNVWQHTPVVAGERVTRTGQPRLDFVGDHQHVVLDAAGR